MSMIEHLESRQLLSVAPLFAHGVPFKAAQLTALSNVTVAGFREKAVDPIGNYSATIDWGDGTSPAAGTIVSDGKGGFLVQGSHTYANAGTDKVTVQISDSDGSSAKAFSLVRVTDAPITATGQDINGVQGLGMINVPVATFVDPDPAATATAPATEIATIVWGSGAPSVGTITQTGPGQFQVSGTHAYLAAGTFAVKTIVRDRGGAVSIANSNANIAVPIPTTSPSLLGTYTGTINVKIKLGFISVGKNEPLVIQIDGQTSDSLTGSITIDGNEVASGTFSGALFQGTPSVERTNGAVLFSQSGSAVTVSVAGKVITDPVTHLPKTFAGSIVASNIPIIGKVNASFTLTKTA
jgi:hypothetical protein